MIIIMIIVLTIFLTIFQSNRAEDYFCVTIDLYENLPPEILQQWPQLESPDILFESFDPSCTLRIPFLAYLEGREGFFPPFSLFHPLSIW